MRQRFWYKIDYPNGRCLARNWDEAKTIINIIYRRAFEMDMDTKVMRRIKLWPLWFGLYKKSDGGFWYDI